MADQTGLFGNLQIFPNVKIEASLICDSASDYHGKLCVLGAFDSIGAPQAPVNHPHCSVVIRIRFERSEEGKHQFRLLLIDADGRPHGIKLEGEMGIMFRPEAETASANLILNLNHLVLPRFGTYHFDFSLDGDQKASMPLYVVQANQLKKAA